MANMYQLRITTAFTLCFILTTNLPLSTGTRFVDLTHKLNKRSEHYQLFKDFELKNVFKKNMPELGMWVEANELSMNEHTGTHVDAPVHTWETGIHMDEVLMEDLIGPGIVISVLEQAIVERDYTLSIADVIHFEQIHGRIPEGAIIILNTGGAKHYHSREDYLGTADPENAATMHFPGFGGPVVKWLIKERGIKGIGVDRMSFDRGQGPHFPAHVALLSKGKFGIENMNNVDKLPPVGSTIIVGALPIEGGSGSPARVVAMINHFKPSRASGSSGGAGGQSQWTLAALVGMLIVLGVLHG